MALVDYAELLVTVRELIAGTGRSVVFEQMNTEGADASKPWKPELGAAVSTTSFATFVPPDGTGLGFETVDEELFKRAKQVCLVAPHATADLTATTVIVDGGIRWRVEWMTKLAPGDTGLLLAFGVAQ